ncbi:hypothetical protein Q0F98_28750 [Paenibacillus amylolyticus]|nr:hypothetical protein Q0F98_28750 [Paenibacillus amylolyticus]
MDITILGALVSGVVGVAGVLIGGILTYKLSHRSEIALIKKKIIIEKIQETQSGLLLMARQLGKLSLALKRIENGQLTQEEFQSISDKVQDECGAVIRNIRVNEFFIKPSMNLIEELFDKTFLFHDLIYDAYIYPNSPSKRNYEPGLLEYGNIERLIMDASLFALKIKERLDDQIDSELN